MELQIIMKFQFSKMLILSKSNKLMKILNVIEQILIQSKVLETFLNTSNRLTKQRIRQKQIHFKTSKNYYRIKRRPKNVTFIINYPR